MCDGMIPLSASSLLLGVLIPTFCGFLSDGPFDVATGNAAKCLAFMCCESCWNES
jgi:hypothetical protein